MSGICCLHRCSRILALRCPFCENTKKATKNPTARPTKGTRRATVPPKPPLKAHMHIVTRLYSSASTTATRNYSKAVHVGIPAPDFPRRKKTPLSRNEPKQRRQGTERVRMSQEQPPFGLPGPILAEIQRRPRSRIKFSWPPSVGILVRSLTIVVHLGSFL